MIKFLFYIFLFFLIMRFIRIVLGIIDTRKQIHRMTRDAASNVATPSAKPGAPKSEGLGKEGQYIDYVEIKE